MGPGQKPLKLSSITQDERDKIDVRDDSVPIPERNYLAFISPGEVTLFLRHRGRQIHNRWTVELDKAWFTTREKALKRMEYFRMHYHLHTPLKQQLEEHEYLKLVNYEQAEALYSTNKLHLSPVLEKSLVKRRDRDQDRPETEDRSEDSVIRMRW